MQVPDGNDVGPTVRAALALSACVVALFLSCSRDEPDLARGRKLLEEARAAAKTDAVDDIVDELKSNFNVNELGVAPKDLEELREQGHLARLRAIAIDVQLSDRDVSRKLEEMEALAKRWKVDLTTIEIRFEGRERSCTPETLELVLRAGFLGEARHWIEEYRESATDADRVANLQMARQYLRDAHATPGDVGVTEPSLARLLERED